MVTDPFPGTLDETTERRMQIVFASLSSFTITANPEAVKQDGAAWFNPDKGTLNVRHNGKVYSWTASSIT